MERRPPLLIVAGPTGIGKTATAVALAQRVPLEVISADSRQVYRGMEVATGKPTASELATLRHHLIDVVEPHERYHAARFRHDAARAIEAIVARGRLPAVVGGTGLYIRTLLRGLDPAPPADPEFRRELETVAVREGRTALHARLGREAPEMASRLHPNDHVRIVRALELIRSGYPVGPAQERWRHPTSEYRVLYVGLTTERAGLARRLRARARAMASAGLEAEVRALLEHGCADALPAMRGIGYREFVDVARGTITREEAIRRMERETVRYAKRQWTWFLREPGIKWLDVEQAGGPEGAAGSIEAMLKEEGLIE